MPPVSNVVTISAPSAHPGHPDYLKLIDETNLIVQTEAPLILQLVPNQRLGVIIAGTELSLSMAHQIAALLQALHPAPAAA